MKKILVLIVTVFVITSCRVDYFESTASPQISKPSIVSFTEKPELTITPAAPGIETPLVTHSKPDPTSASTQETISAPTEESCGVISNGRSVYLDEYPTFEIRQGPGCEYEELAGKLVKPFPFLFFEVLGKQGDWLLVDLCENKQGWVFAPAIANINLDVVLDDLAVITPPPPSGISPTGLPDNQNEDSIDQARKTLVTFFDHLYNKNYSDAVEVFGGGYGIVINWNSDVDPSDYPTLLMRGCEVNGFQCFLRVNRIIEEVQVSAMEYHFTVEFIMSDGTIYQRSGPNEETITQFTFRVARDCNGSFYVIDWPFYEQAYGN